MNTYSKALRHISMKDVKQKHQQKLIEQKIQEERKKEEEEYIASVMEEKKYDWRKKLNEGMTSTGLFFTTLPATGDVDLSSIDVTNQSSFSDIVNVDFGSDSFFSQYGEIENALTFSSYKTTPYAFINPIDTTTIDTISFTGVAGDFSNGSLPTNSDLIIGWYNYDNAEDGQFLAISKTATNLSTYNITLPPEAKGKNVEFYFVQPRSSQNAGQDLTGYSFPVGDESVEITDDNDGLIASLLVNYDETDNADIIRWGRLIASNISRNTSDYDGVSYPDLFYPGYVGPVSGNIGDPNITGFNGDLNIAKNNVNSIGFLSGFFGSNTQQQMIDLFDNTTLDGSQFYLDLREWDRLFNLSIDFYQDYIYYSGQGNEALADYYLNLSNENGTLANNMATTVKNSVNAASALPDSRWTDEDYAKVATDIYNLYKGASSYAITNFSTKRRTPQNVFVPLDSPEASSFIRTDPIMSNLSPQERRQKLIDMLRASDQYVTKMLGRNFPGTGAVPPGDYDPFKQAPAGEAGDTPGVQVTDYQNAPGYMDIQVGDERITRSYDSAGNYTGADSGWQPDPNYDAYKAGGGDAKMNQGLSYDQIVALGNKNISNVERQSQQDFNNYKNSINSPTSTTSQQISQIQKAVLSSPEVANAAEKLGTAGKTYLDYLTNNLPNVIDNNYLGQEYVNSIFKDAKINHMGTVSVGDNIVGTGGKPTYDPKTKTVSIPFNYDFKTNDQEFSDPSKAGRVNDFQKTVLNALGPYSADAQLNTPILPLNSLAGIVLGGAIGVSKALGGGQAKKGNVTMDADKLKKINPSLYNQIVKEEVTSEGKLISEKKLKSPKEVLDRIPGYYDGKPAPLGFPETPPPKMVNGMHPDLVDGKKVADRFNRLDPESAKAMPPTGNPHIDKKVKAAAKKPK